MSSNNETDDTWSGYLGHKLALTLDAVQSTAAATIEYGKERITTPDVSHVTEKMCFEFNSVNETFDGINDRLEQSKMASNPRIQTEFGHVAAGRQGEDLVQKELEKLGSVRSAVRIPGTSGKRSEIDLVLQTRSHIYLFEVKYWSGNVELTPDGKWKQIRNKNSNPPEIEHENVLDRVREKELLFREKLNLPKSSVSSFIVFPKTNLTLTYAIGREPQVLSSQEFYAWVEAEIPSGIKSVAELVLPKSWTGFNEATTEKIDGTLGTCGTWDLVHLEGGRTLTGDFRSGPRELGKINRTEIASAKFSHVRNALIGGALAVFGSGPKTTVYLYRRNADLFSSMFSVSCQQFELLIDSVIIFREAGQRTDTRVQINDIKQIEFSQK